MGTQDAEFAVHMSNHVKVIEKVSNFITDFDNKSIQNKLIEHHVIRVTHDHLEQLPVTQ